MRFPLDFLFEKRLQIVNRFKRLTRIIGLLLLLGLLPACSAVKIFYNQSPDFAYWYLDGYLDFTGAQSLRVKSELGRLQAWHRQTQLPGYIDTLEKLKRQIPSDIDAATACGVYADVRSKLISVSDRAEPAALAVVRTLNASQLTQMERQFAKTNANYREDFLEGTTKERRDKRYQQAVRRAEMLYGTLDEKQLTVIGQQIDRSLFDAVLAYAEKLRRQQDALQTLRLLAKGQHSSGKAQASLHDLFGRAFNSPDRAYRDYMDKLTRQGCNAVADLHNSTTPAQRSKAGETLDSYVQDFRTLSAQKS